MNQQDTETEHVTNQPSRHEFKPPPWDSPNLPADYCAFVKSNAGYCGLPESADVHQPAKDYRVKIAPEGIAVEKIQPETEGRVEEMSELLPQERIVAHVCKTGTIRPYPSALCSNCPQASEGSNLTLRQLCRADNATIDALKDALEGLIQRRLSSGPCWCVYPSEVPLEYFENARAKDGHDNGFRHENECTAARDVLSQLKEK